MIRVCVPRKLKELMDKFKDVVNWSEEIRGFIERRVKELHCKKILVEVRGVIEQLPETPAGTTSRYVREDRDSN
ncbi:MAG: CopG family transcriptional regulator [Desulfurococcus sp.]|nr:CopG family transcriptional regulator [Desulfurococcus sp.]